MQKRSLCIENHEFIGRMKVMYFELGTWAIGIVSDPCWNPAVVFADVKLKFC